MNAELKIKIEIEGKEFELNEKDARTLKNFLDKYKF